MTDKVRYRFAKLRLGEILGGFESHALRMQKTIEEIENKIKEVEFAIAKQKQQESVFRPEGFQELQKNIGYVDGLKFCLVRIKKEV